MNTSEVESDRRTRIFSILSVIWISLFLVTGLLLPVIAVLYRTPAFDVLKYAWFVVGGMMVLLALFMAVLCMAGFAAGPCAAEPKDTPWPLVLAAGFIFAGLLASGLLLGKTAGEMGTGKALVEMGRLLGLFVLPFAVLAIIVPSIVRRYSTRYAGTVGSVGYVAAMLIDYAVWLSMSGRSVASALERLGIAVLLAAVGYLLFLALRRDRKKVRN